MNNWVIQKSLLFVLPLKTKESYQNSSKWENFFTYGFFNVKQLNIPCISLCDYNTLIKVALDKKIIQEEEKRILANWQQTFNI